MQPHSRVESMRPASTNRHRDQVRLVKPSLQHPCHLSQPGTEIMGEAHRGPWVGLGTQIRVP